MTLPLLALLRVPLLTGALVLVCANPIVVGGIPPSQFIFNSIVRAGKQEPSGWKAAQVLVTLNRMSATGPVAFVCRIEVGVPEINHQEPISNVAAQSAAAKASDQAARIVLAEQGLLTATACFRFREEMERILEKMIPGAKVSDFISKGIRHTTFP